MQYQTDFRKGLDAQKCLLVVIEKFRKSLDEGAEYAALLTDLLKAFDVFHTTLFQVNYMRMVLIGIDEF